MTGSSWNVYRIASRTVFSSFFFSVFSFSTSDVRVHVAQWIERSPCVREVMGSIPVGDSGIFFVPRSCHVE